MIDINQLEQCIKRDLNDTQSFPFMVIANAGKIKILKKKQNLGVFCLFRYCSIRSL